MDNSIGPRPEARDAGVTDRQTLAALRAPRDLVYENAESVLAEFRSAFALSPDALEIDLSAVTAMDSSGLKALIGLRRTCEEQGVEFRIIAVSECAARVIRLSTSEAFFGLGAIPVISETAQHSVSAPGFTGWRSFERVADSAPGLVSVLRENVAEIAADAGAAEDALCDIRIAVGEALANAYKHGSPRKGTDKITLRCFCCSQALVVEILDEGPPFDPSNTCAPDPETIRDHGMGIHLMREAMDVVEFRCGSPGNRVRMVKWLK